MKQNKWIRILSAAMGLLLTASCCPFSAAAAESDAAPSDSAVTEIDMGDVTESGSIGVTDLVALQKYLLGNNPLNDQQFWNSDMNLDGTVNGMDLSSLKGSVLQEQPMRSRFQRVDILSYTSAFWERAFGESPSAVITSAEELEDYLAPVMEENNLAVYLDLYDASFFQDNVLCLCAFGQTNGGVEYGMESVSRNGDTWNITYSKTSDTGLSIDIVLSVLMQVSIPKELYRGETVTWIRSGESGDTLTPTIQLDQHFYCKAEPTDDAGAVITSAEQLSAYLSQYFYDENVQPYLEKYDSSFFQNNVLFLNVLHQSAGDGVEYAIPDVSYRGSDLYITYIWDETVGSTADVVSDILAQVSLPKSQYRADAVVWENGRTADLTVTLQCDSIPCAAVTEKGWQTALRQNASFTLRSEQDLTEKLSPLFQDAVLRSLQSTYDAGFFNENILYVNLAAAPDNHDYHYAMTDAEYNTRNQLQFNYEKVLIDGYEPAAIYLQQAVLPESQEYVISSPVWKEEGYRTISGSFSSTDMDMLEQAMDSELVQNYEFCQGKWVFSQEELNECLSACLTEEGIANFQYSDTFFDTNAVYVIVDDDIIGTTDHAWRIRKTSDQILVSCTKRQPVSCYGGLFVHTLSVPREEAEHATVKFEWYNLDSLENLWNDSSLLLYDGPDGMTALAVRQYQFGQESDVNLYQALPSGMMRYGEMQQLGAFPLEETSFNPFDSDYTTTTDQDGTTVYTGEYFTITWKAETALIEFYTSEEKTSKETFEVDIS